MLDTKAVLGIATTLLVLSGSQAAAQTAPAPMLQPPHQPHFELMLNSGTLIPTGEQRDAVKRGNVSVAQVWYEFDRSFAITASFGWARSRDLIAAGDPKLDLFTYDVGAEVRADRWIAGERITVTPFAGAGAGGRSYNHRNLDVDATHNAGGYASAGAEIGIGSRVGVRLEARDYVSRFQPLTGVGEAEAHNDVMLTIGLSIRMRRS